MRRNVPRSAGWAVVIHAAVLSPIDCCCACHHHHRRYDFVNALGIRVSQSGPHLFHTSSERVWGYTQRFANWTRYQHRVVGRVDGYVRAFARMRACVRE